VSSSLADGVEHRFSPEPIGKRQPLIGKEVKEAIYHAVWKKRER
jgi:hypothetical protein